MVFKKPAFLENASAFTGHNGTLYNNVSNTAIETEGIIPGKYKRQSNKPKAAIEKQITLLKFFFRNTSRGCLLLK